MKTTLYFVITLLTFVTFAIVPNSIAQGNSERVCQVGDVLAAGESCTYPDTNTKFSVDNNGNGRFLFFSSGSRLNIRNTQINNVSYTLVAEKRNSGDWQIKELGNLTAPPPKTNNAPVFTEGTTTRRTVAQNTAASTNIGTPVSATDADNDTLTYSLGGTDAASFSIVSTTGQLQTKAALDGKTKTSYSVTVSVSDGKGGSNNITVTITVTDVNGTPINSAPVFSNSDPLTITHVLPPKGNTEGDYDIGEPLFAKDPDGDSVNYSLSGTDANLFHTYNFARLVDGQFQSYIQLTTRGWSLHDANKSSFTLIVTASDFYSNANSITVTINLAEANTDPVFTDDGFCRVGDVLASGESCTYPGTDTKFSVNSNGNGQFLFFSSGNSLNIRDTQINNVSYTLVAEKRNSGDWQIKELGATAPPVAPPPTTNHAPVFTEAPSTTRTIAENTAAGVNIGTPIAATDADNDTLTYSLGGIDAAAFSIVSTTGQLQTRVALDYETKNAYTVTVSVSDGKGGSATIAVTITVTDVIAEPPPTANNAPVFIEGTSTTRTVAENTAAGVNIGTPIAATDADNDLLIYTLGGTDAASFNIDNTTGQLKTAAPLNANTKSTYTVTLSVSDSKGGNNNITVTITVTGTGIAPPPVEPPPVADGFCRVGDVLASGESCTYPGTDTEFSVNSNGNGQFLFFSSSNSLNIRNTQINNVSYTLVAEKRNSGDWQIKELGATAPPPAVPPPTTNNAPVFTEAPSTTRTVIENTATGVSIGTPIAATDVDNDTLTYTLGGIDAAAFSIVSTTGQLQTRVALDYETKNAYTVVVTASDGSLSDTITVTITVTDITVEPPPTANNAPVFTEGPSTTRTIAENTAAGTNIGTPIAATDADNDALIYTLGGTDAASFNIDSTTGQLKTSSILNANTKSTYTVTLSVSDSKGGSNNITVTITVSGTGVAPPPVVPPPVAPPPVADGFCRVGDVLASGESCTYPGTDTEFSVNSNGNGQFLFFSSSNSLNIRNTQINNTSYTLVAEKRNSGDWQIKELGATAPPPPTTTNNAPVFTDGVSTIRSVAENTAAGQNIGSAVSATDADSGDTLTYTLSGIDAAAFDIDSTTGQLKTKTTLNAATKSTYTVTVTVSDGTLTATISVTINVTGPGIVPPPVAPPPVADGFCRVGDTLAAGESCTYPGTDTEFSVNSNGNGQFLFFSSSSSLNIRDTQINNVSYTLVAEKRNSGDWGIKELGATAPPPAPPPTTTNTAPVFTEGSSTTRSIAENTVSGTNIGTAVSATDADNDTLTYSLGGTDASSFSLVSTSGQLQTRAALDYETRSSYSVTVSVSDGNGGADSITVTISVTNVNEGVPNNAPRFTAGTSTTRSIAENTASGTNLGTAVSATDADTGDTLTYTLSGTDASAFSLVSTSGQLQTRAALDYETKASYSVTVSVSDGNGGTNSITVTINVTDVTETSTITPAISARTPAVRDTIVAAAGVNSANDVTAAHLAAITSLNLARASISSLKTGDFNGLTALTELGLGYNALTSLPSGIFDDLTNLTWLVLGSNALASLPSGIFDDLTNLTQLYLDDNDLSALPAGIFDNNTKLTKLELESNDLSALPAGIFDNLTVLTELGLGYNNLTSFPAVDGLTALKVLWLYNNNLSSLPSDTFDNLTTLTQLYLGDNPQLRSLPSGVFDNLTALTTLRLDNTGLSSLPSGIFDELTALGGLGLGNNNLSSLPSGIFDELTKLTYLALNHNQISDVSELEDLTSLTELHLRGNPISDYGPLRRLKAANRNVLIDITIPSESPTNNAPVFTAGTSTTRSVAENTAAGTNIGSAVAATDTNTGDTLTYSLSGTNASSFSLVSTTGQLQTKAALDYETKTSYSVTISVSDGKGGTDSITVTINVTNVNEGVPNNAPVFTAGTSTIRSVAENTASGQNIGTALSATDADNDTLTYTLGGTNAASFSIVSTTGQLQTSAALDYENKSSYSVTVSVSDSKGGTDSITVTINITDVTETISPPLSTRTSQVRAAIVAAVPGVTNADDVTAAHLAAITILNLSNKSISSLKTGDFNGLTALTQLWLHENSISDISVLEDLTALTKLGLRNNSINDISALEDLTALTWLYLGDNSISDISALEHLTALTKLGLSDNPISDISALEHLTALTDLSLFKNSISDISASISDISALEHLTALKTLHLAGNSITDISALEHLTKLTNLSLGGNSITDISALEHLTALTGLLLSGNSITDISALEHLTKLKTLSLSNNSISDISELEHLTKLTNLSLNNNSISDISELEHLTKLTQLSLSNNSISDISELEHLTKLTNLWLRGNPISDYGPLRRLKAANPGVFIDINLNNNPPVFGDGTSTTRSVEENTASGQNIGTAVAATDADNHTLTYSLSGTDAASFTIVSTSGQLQTRAALDYENKTSYSVTITVYDGNSGGDRIDVTINITDVDEDPNTAPAFSATSTTRTVNENEPTNTDVGAVVTATDTDTLTYSIPTTGDAAAFSIDSSTGQLKTGEILDHETKASYTVVVTASDNSLSDTISVTINVTDVNDPPVFTEGDTATRSIAENTATNTDIGTAVAATDQDQNAQGQPKDTITYSIPTTGDAAAFTIVSTTGQLKTKNALNYENDNSYTVVVTASDGTLSDTISVTISVTDVNEGPNTAPVFTDGTSTTRSIAEKTASGQNIGTAIAATDADNDTLTYTLGGTDASSFSIVSTSGQLQTSAALDYETQTSYSVTVSVSDGNGGSDSITVTINVTTISPPLSERTSQLRDVIVSKVSGVTNADDVTAAHLAAITFLPLSAQDSITSLKSGDFNGFTGLTDLRLSSNNRLTSLPSDIFDPLTNLTKLSLTHNGFSSLPSDIFDELTALTTLSLYDNNFLTSLPSGIFDELTALTDLGLGDNDRLTSLPSGIFDELTALTTLNLNSSRLTSLSSDIFDELTALTTLYWGSSRLTSLPSGIFDELTALTTLHLNNNNISDVSELEDLTSLTTLKLSGNSISDYGPLRRLKAAIEAIEDHPGLTLDITIPPVGTNNAPVFSDGTSTTRSVAEKTAAGQNIGAAVAATDADSGNTLTYTLSGTDAASFSIVSTSGQLQTKAPLDYERKTSYSVTVSVSDGNNGSDSITVTINITNVDDAAENDAPTFTDGATTTRSVAENTTSGQNIGTPVAATDADNDILTYSLGGTDASSFSIVSTSGQLQTSAALDYETDTSYEVTVSVSDVDGGSDSITVTISVTEVSAGTTYNVSDNINTLPSGTWTPDVSSGATFTSQGGTITISFDDDGYIEEDGTTYTCDNATGCKIINGQVTQGTIVATTTSGAPSAQQVKPPKSALLPNFPNPFNPETWIPYQLAKPADVTLTVYNMRGVVVRELKLGHKPAGMYQHRSRAIHWDGRNMFGEKVATGVYFYTLKAGDFTATRKMLIRK